jgi:IMP dehydrogenase/GMP reductase
LSDHTSVDLEEAIQRNQSASSCKKNKDKNKKVYTYRDILRRKTIKSERIPESKDMGYLDAADAQQQLQLRTSMAAAVGPIVLCMCLGGIWVTTSWFQIKRRRAAAAASRKNRRPHITMFAADGLCEQGPRLWPLLGASLEQLAYFPVMHDWLLHHFQRRRTFRVPMPTCTYTYTIDPANIEHILKTNFSNYPKVQRDDQGDLAAFEASGSIEEIPGEKT